MLVLRRLAAAASVAAVLCVLFCTATVTAVDNGTGGIIVVSGDDGWGNFSGSGSGATPAPPVSGGSAAAYRIRLWAYAASYAIAEYRAALRVAFTIDVARALGVSAASVTVNDLVLHADTSENVTVVVVVRGASVDVASVLTASGNAPASWANTTNALLALVWYSIAERRAVRAVADGFYTSLYVTGVERLPSPDLPRTRYFEIVLEGKHLGAAMARAAWSTAIRADLGTAFGIAAYMATHFNVTSQAAGGVNQTKVTLRFFIMPVAAVAVNAVTFFATRGAAAWLTHVTAVHKDAAYAAWNISTPAPMVLGRGAVAQADTLPESEYAVTVTSTSYAPGDESYSAADGVARGAAVVGASVMMVLLSLVMF